MGDWTHWQDLLNMVMGVSSLLFTAFSLREETKTRRVGNLITLAQNHRALWSSLFQYPQLGRVLDARGGTPR